MTQDHKNQTSYTRAGAPKHYVSPSFSDVEVKGFWGRRAKAVAQKTIHILYDRALKARMFEQIDVQQTAPGKIVSYDGGLMTSQMFWDSDFGKIIECAAYCLNAHQDADLETKIDAIIDLYEKLQLQDGYLNSWFQRIEPGLRWSNLRDTHELYNAGHLIEGAVAYFQATGKRKLLDIMCRFVDHIMEKIGPEPHKINGYCGHPEIELALMKLYRVTQNRAHLSLAKYFIDERGKRPNFFEQEASANGRDPKDFHYGTMEFNQSHAPVRDQKHVVGHAVRAMYLYAAMADVAAEFDDEDLENALQHLWRDLTEKKLYITGGLGPSKDNEGFTNAYDLPNKSAYAETCAAVGLVFWASRMLRLRPDRRYADMLERALYNGALSGLSLDGASFLYENPLASDGDHQRWTWHRCPCCPPNIARLTASIGSYMYGVTEGAIAVHLFGESRARLRVRTPNSLNGEAQNPDGYEVQMDQKTSYPHAGKVEITISPEQPIRFALQIRVPEWSAQPDFFVNGQKLILPIAAETPDRPQVQDGSNPLQQENRLVRMMNGYIVIDRLWHANDKVTFEMDMSVKQIYANPKISEDLGKVAFQRGPFIYCAEAHDNAHPLRAYRIAPDAKVKLSHGQHELEEMILLHIGAQVPDQEDWGGELYRSSRHKMIESELVAIPYFAWANRSAGPMAVWLESGQ